MSFPATFPIGTEFKTRGKHPRHCTVIDIHRTYNAANELVKTEYQTTHEFCGQTVKAMHNRTTIAMGFIK